MEEKTAETGDDSNGGMNPEELTFPDVGAALDRKYELARQIESIQASLHPETPWKERRDAKWEITRISVEIRRVKAWLREREHERGQRRAIDVLADMTEVLDGHTGASLGFNVVQLIREARGMMNAHAKKRRRLAEASNG